MLIVILSSHSLFTDGVASRLREYPQRIDVRFVDPQQPDYVEQINAIQPAAIVIDAANEESPQCCPLCDLLVSFSNLTIFYLEAQQNDIQIVTSVRHSLNEIRDLIEIVERFPQVLGQSYSVTRKKGGESSQNFSEYP